MTRVHVDGSFTLIKVNVSSVNISWPVFKLLGHKPWVKLTFGSTVNISWPVFKLMGHNPWVKLTFPQLILMARVHVDGLWTLSKFNVSKANIPCSCWYVINHHKLEELSMSKNNPFDSYYKLMLCCHFAFLYFMMVWGFFYSDWVNI